MKTRFCFSTVLVLSACFQLHSQVENPQPHFTVKGVAIGISAPELVDMMMVTMPGLGSNAKAMLNLQSVKTYMMPPRKAGASVGTASYTLASCMEFYSNFEKNYKVNLSPDFITLQVGVENKSDVKNSLKFLVIDGTVTADALPYGTPEIPKNFASPIKHRLSNYLQIFQPAGREKQKVFEVQKALMRGNPVIVEMQVPEDFEKIRNTKFWTSVGSEPNKVLPFLIVSYNLDLEAFEIQSSWGREWGSDGYLWVDFADFGRMAQNAYVMVPASL